MLQSLQDDTGYNFKGSAFKIDLYTGRILWSYTIVPEGFYGAFFKQACGACLICFENSARIYACSEKELRCQVIKHRYDSGTWVTRCIEVGLCAGVLRMNKLLEGVSEYSCTYQCFWHETHCGCLHNSVVCLARGLRIHVQPSFYRISLLASVIGSSE